jgi:maltokinase
VIDATELARMLPDFLPRQRWYAGGGRVLQRVDVAAFEVLRGGPDDWPMMIWAIADAVYDDGGPSARYQIPVGVRPLDDTQRFLEGKGRNLLGDLDTDSGPVLVYDALVDPDLALAVLERAAPDEAIERVWPVPLEHSNTSVVFDERLIMKLFRRIHGGPNPDVEVPNALAGVGFEHVPATLGVWRSHGADLVVVREFLLLGTDGWHLSLASLRDMYDRREHPAMCGGDFAPEAERLGVITASLHVAMAKAFGAEPAQPADWAEAMRDIVASAPAERFDAAAVQAVIDRLAGVDPRAAGSSTRVHGDFHLGQIMRTDQGWFILDFEGEPELDLDVRRQRSSPLRDVAGMLRSFHYATQVGLLERGDGSDTELAALAQVWEERNARAFLVGYQSVDDVLPLLPSDQETRRVVLDAFVVAKAVYELSYEIGYRPEYVGIPLAGLARQLGGGAAAGWAWAGDDG